LRTSLVARIREGELIAVLFLDLEGDVELVLSAPLAGTQVGGALHGLEVAELVDALDGELQGSVLKTTLVEVDLATDTCRAWTGCP
jgi:hypothetical protein